MSQKIEYPSISPYIWLLLFLFIVLVSFFAVSSKYILVLIISILILSPALWKLFVNQKYLIIAILLSILPGMLGRFSLSGKGGATILLTDIFVCIMVCGYIFKKIYFEKKIDLTQTHKSILVFFLIAFGSYVNGIFYLNEFGQIELKELITSFLYLIRWLGYSIILFVMYDDIKSMIDIKKWVFWLKWIVFITAILGFLQLIFYPDFFEMFVKYGWDPHKDRLLGTFFDPNLIGAFLAMNISFLFGILFFGKDNSKSSYLLSIVLIIALVLTLSRSAYLGFVLGFAILSFLKNRKIFMIGFLVVLLGIFLNPAVFDRVSQGISIDDSAEKHIESWVDGIHLIQSFPLIGIGYNMLPSVYDDLGLVDEWDVNNRSGIENSLMTVWVTMGIMGVLSYLWIWLSILYMALKNAKNKKIDPYLRGVNYGVFGAILSVFTCSIFVNTLFFSYIVVYMWIFAAFTIVTYYKSNFKIS